MKKIVSLILTAVLLLTLAACGTAQNDEQSTNANTKAPESTASTANGNETDPDNTAETGTEQTVSGDGKILVVYFSWSGNLDKMAHWIADETGGDLVRVTAKEAYPENYNATADRAKKEKDDGLYPEINVDLTKEQMAQYDTVFFGFPVWWYDLPMSMWTFLESYDFSGKTVIPFFSHEGSSNGAGALPRVTELAKGANVRTDDALSIRGGSVASLENAVRDWVKGLNY